MLTSGERINFDQVTYWEISGGDITVFWNKGTAAINFSVFVGGATDATAIDIFLAEPQDFKHDGVLITDDLTPPEYNRDLFIRGGMLSASDAILNNRDILAAFDKIHAQGGVDRTISLTNMAYELGVLYADKWELENP